MTLISVDINGSPGPDRYFSPIEELKDDLPAHPVKKIIIMKFQEQFLQISLLTLTWHLIKMETVSLKRNGIQICLSSANIVMDLSCPNR
jgi:hypothetical protein